MLIYVKWLLLGLSSHYALKCHKSLFRCDRTASQRVQEI